MDLTRRGLIGRAVAAGGALATGGTLLAPARIAFAGDDGEAVFDARVPRSRAARASGGRAARASARSWRSGPIRAPRAFELVAIQSRSDAEIRVQDAHGRWSDWLALPVAHGHGPDGETSELSDPAWTGRARVYELRAGRPLGGARIVFVDPGRARGASTAAAQRFVDSGLPAGPGQPRIISRAAWATPACRPRDAASFGGVDLMFVHHTVNANFYSARQSAALVRSICLFHKYGNGWDDIGYNFVVDRYGQVFEARAGGIDEPVVGAQAGGYNVYSSGVGLLGSFSSGGPSRRAFDALANLVAWKLALHGVSATGRVTVQVTRTGAPYSRYGAGARVTLNRISGHRDADTTSCPGAGMYRQLPRLRQVVRRLAEPVSSLTLAQTAAGPGAASVAGMLTRAAVPLAGVEVEIQHRSGAAQITVARAITAGDGSFSANVPLPRNSRVRAVFRGSETSSAVVSRAIAAVVPPAITMSGTPAQVAPGGVVLFTGTITPLKPRLTLVVSQQQPDGTFAVVRTINFGPDGDGMFARTVGFAAAGSYSVAVQSAADERSAAGSSPAVAVAVA